MTWALLAIGRGKNNRWRRHERPQPSPQPARRYGGVQPLRPTRPTIPVPGWWWCWAPSWVRLLSPDSPNFQNILLDEGLKQKRTRSRSGPFRPCCWRCLCAACRAMSRKSASPDHQPQGWCACAGPCSTIWCPLATVFPGRKLPVQRPGLRDADQGQHVSPPLAEPGAQRAHLLGLTAYLLMLNWKAHADRRCHFFPAVAGSCRCSKRAQADQGQPGSHRQPWPTWSKENVLAQRDIRLYAAQPARAQRFELAGEALGAWRCPLAGAAA